MADDEHRAVAEALNAHLSGSGDWSKATPAMAEVAIAALDRVRDVRDDDEAQDAAAYHRVCDALWPYWSQQESMTAEEAVKRLVEAARSPQSDDHEADERALGTPLGARQRAQTQRDVADILEFGSPQGEDPTDNPTDKPSLQCARSPQGEGRDG